MKLKDRKASMNILDYLETEFATFDEKPFGEVDALVLSEICMARFDDIAPSLKEKSLFADIGTIVENLFSSSGRGVTFRDALRAEFFDRMFIGLVPKRTKDLLIALAASPRFRDIVIRDYLSLFDTERQTQFAAMAFVHKKEFAFLGFRGTDSSFTGWKEDFNMAFTCPVPAQDQAVRYVESASGGLPKRLMLGGHSKGGNLAVYAAINADPKVQARIERVYDFDGPGFKPSVFTGEEYAKLKDRIVKIVPVDSIVGMLMESHEDYRVVASDAKGINAHSGFTWQLNGDRFAFVDSISDSARFTDQVITEWLGSFSDEELAVIVDAMFEAIAASGAENATDILSGGAKTVQLLMDANKNTGEPARTILTEAIKRLSEIVLRRFGRDVTVMLGGKGK